MKLKSIRYGGAALVLMLAVAVLMAVGVVPAPGVGEKEFLVKSFSPQGQVTGRAEIKAVFNRAVVAADKVGISLTAAEMPFSFSPSISGSGKWIDEKTFVYHPRAGLLSFATSYTATAKAGLSDTEMRLLAGKQSFSFHTAPLSFSGARQVNFDPQTGETVYELEFSLPVSPLRLRGYLDVTDKNGRALDYKVVRSVVSRKVRLAVRSAEDVSAVRLKLAAGLPSESGPLGLEKSLTVDLSKSAKMDILDSNAVSNINNGEIYIETSAPVDFAKAEAYVELSPKIACSFEPRDRGFAITGAFAPQDRVTVTLRKGFPALGGKPLSEKWSRSFIFPEKKAGIKLAAPGRVLSPQSGLRLPLETVNLDRVHIIVWKLYENNIPFGMKSSWAEYPLDLSSIKADKTYKVRSERNKTVRSALDLGPLIGAEKGVFLIVAQNGDENEWAEDRQVINVTDLGVTLKKGPDSALFWVNSVKEGKPVSGASVTLWSWANQPVAEGKTDRDGAVSLNISGENDEGVLATVKKDGDIAFIRMENGLFAGRSEFETGGEPWVNRGYTAYCYLPRDIFRPGERIPFRALLRDANGEAPKPFPAQLSVYSPTGKVWSKQSVKLTKEGVLNALITIPPGAPTGAWTAAVTAAPGDMNNAGFKEFYVEEFVAPRLFVEASIKEKRLVGKQKLNYAISAKYAFGSPAAGLATESELSVSEKEFTHKDWKGFSFIDLEKEFSPGSFFVGEGKLNKEGKTSGTAEEREISAPSMAEVSLRAGVMEEGGRWVYKTVSVPWYPAGAMVGISMPQEAAPGKKVPFTAAAVTFDGKAAAAKELRYSFFRVVERAVTYENNDRSGSKVQEEFLPKGSGTLTLKNGKAAAAVLPSEGGKYFLRVEDPATGIKASHWLYAYGDNNEKGSVLPDMVRITTDKKSYKVGESAKVKVLSPFAGKILLNVETYKVVSRQIVTMKGKETELTVKITPEMLPNGWITAQAVRPQPKDGGESRAYGVVPLMLDNSASKLTVEIKKPGKIEPGKNNFSLTVKNHRGAGTEADVTVMLVDEAVLGLTGYETPDPWKFLTAKKALSVETYDLYGVLIAPESHATPLLTAGGGAADSMFMKNSSLNPVQAKRFKMLSLLKTVRSDASGKCDFSFVVPEFAGKARLMAVAVTAKESGTAAAAVEINREMILEPSLPRVLAPQDSFSAPCQIFNKKGRDETVSLTVETSGPLKLQSEAHYKATVKAGGSLTVPLSFKAAAAGTAKVTYQLKWQGGEQKNAAEIAVRPASPRVSISGSLLVKPKESLKTTIPAGWYDGTFSGTAMLSAMPQIALSELASFLITYPHGCFEQTVSSAWPLLLQADLARAADPSLADDKAVRKALAVRIEKIAALQNYDGGFVRWQGESWSQPWESIYGAHFLVEAKKANVKVPEEVLKASLTYIRRLLSSSPENTEKESLWKEALTRRAYSCYVLALAGDPQLGWMESLRDKSSSLDPSGRLFLAAAYAVSGQKNEAAKMAGGKLAVIKKIPGGTDNYDSDLRNSAISLLAAVHIDPKSANSASQAASLTEKLSKAKYYNTQEGGLSLLALAKYFHAQPREGAPSGRLEADRLTLGKVAGKELTFIVPLKKPASLTAVNNGESRLFAAWTVSGVPLTPLKNHDNGIEARVKLTERSGKAAGSKIARGTALIATLTITPKAGTLKEVVVSMPLAAGLEIEKASYLAAGESASPNVRAEARDDRLLLYISRLEKPLVWRCAIRAVTEGNFIVPQTSAECMYDPAVTSLTGGGKLEITKGK